MSRETIVVVNGTFDILHAGHLKLLALARSLGSRVIVCIDSDKRIKELKGPDRPINSQQDRVLMLEALKYVDSVHIFDTDLELRNTIRGYAPDYMVKGSDYANKPVIGDEYCRNVVYLKRDDKYSTTKTIKSIASR